MGGYQSNTSNISQSTMTSILNQSAQTCQASCTANQSGNVIIIDGGNIQGSVGFSENCKVTASCTMVQSLDTQVENIISAIAEQSNTALTGFMGDLSFNAATNSVNIRNSITNYITNITESTCSSRAVMSQSNNLLYASNANVSGSNNNFFGFQIGSSGNPISVQSACSMSNISKVSVYNQENASSKQSNLSVSSLGLIAVALILFIVMIVIIVIVSAVGKGKKKLLK